MCSVHLLYISKNMTDDVRTTIAIQYIPRNMHTVFDLLCFVVVIHWLIFLYPSGLLHWHCGNLTIAPVPAKQTWWIWINTSCEFIMNDCITTTKQSTTKPCAYFLGFTVDHRHNVIDLLYSLIFQFIPMNAHVSIVTLREQCLWKSCKTKCRGIHITLPHWLTFSWFDIWNNVSFTIGL